MITVHLQEDNFDSGSIHNSVGLHRTDIGAKICFTGIVKDLSNDGTFELWVQKRQSLWGYTVE